MDGAQAAVGADAVVRPATTISRLISASPMPPDAWTEEWRARWVQLLTRSGVRRLEELLPDAFGPADLANRPAAGG